jgi:hypothetical protein
LFRAIVQSSVRFDVDECPRTRLSYIEDPLTVSVDDGPPWSVEPFGCRSFIKDADLEPALHAAFSELQPIVEQLEPGADNTYRVVEIGCPRR